MSTKQNYNNAPILMCKRINLKSNAKSGKNVSFGMSKSRYTCRVLQECKTNNKYNY